MGVEDIRLKPKFTREYAIQVQARFSGINLKMHVSDEEAD